jgi:hypothetical protein
MAATRTGAEDIVAGERETTARGGIEQEWQRGPQTDGRRRRDADQQVGRRPVECVDQKLEHSSGRRGRDGNLGDLVQRANGAGRPSGVAEISRDGIGGNILTQDVVIEDRPIRGIPHEWQAILARREIVTRRSERRPDPFEFRNPPPG